MADFEMPLYFVLMVAYVIVLVATSRLPRRGHPSTRRNTSAGMRRKNQIAS